MLLILMNVMMEDFFLIPVEELITVLSDLGHSVLEFSDRDIVRHYKSFSDHTGSKALNRKLINTVYNYKPDLLIFGHADLM